MFQVTVSNGVLEGELVEDELVKFYSFKGIPYAAPPVEDLRFKAPLPPQPWVGVRSAKSFGPNCYQFNIISNTTYGSEDCLYLNVYTPDMESKEPLPVMVWFHGGAFMFGSGNDGMYGPDFLLRHGVILVTLNYRIGTLGFLCLDSEEVPGNAGLKDQVAALKWVNKNISHFGGDPGNVTIFGVSAGGACVSGHTLSPMSKGLFRRAIAQSGTAINAWATPWEPFLGALYFARKLGFYSEDKQELYEFFKNQPVENLIDFRGPLTMHDLGKGFGDIKHAMVVEKDFGQERFLVRDIHETLRDGIHEGVDMMVGYTEDEGVYITKIVPDIDAILNKISLYDDFLVPNHISLNSSQSVKFEVGRRFKKYYFKNNFEPNNENLFPIFKYIGMDRFVYGIMQWAKFWSVAKKNTYFYKFTCKSERNFMTDLLGERTRICKKMVVNHTDDLPYLFPVKLKGLKISKESETFKLIDQVTRLWTNFAKYGNPTPDDSLGVRWIPFSLEKQEYLDIGNQLKADFFPNAEELELWEGIFREFSPKYLFHLIYNFKGDDDLCVV